jgi:hypothetical protein
MHFFRFILSCATAVLVGWSFSVTKLTAATAEECLSAYVAALRARDVPALSSLGWTRAEELKTADESAQAYLSSLELLDTITRRDLAVGAIAFSGRVFEIAFIRKDGDRWQLLPTDSKGQTDFSALSVGQKADAQAMQTELLDTVRAVGAEPPHAIVPGSPRAKVAELAAAVKKQDWDAARALFSDPTAFDGDTPWKIEQLGNLRVGYGKEDGDYAVVMFFMQLAENWPIDFKADRPGNFLLIKQDGAWKIVPPSAEPRKLDAATQKRVANLEAWAESMSAGD